MRRENHCAMAVDVNNAKRSCTIAFTLPISCQICLGKVKQPLLCPNNHVFCSPCLEVWLERNKQCPACRTPIDEQNPCKEIRGGISVVEEEGGRSSSMSTAEIRRARFEMLFKDYESELSHTNAKLEALKIENTALQKELEMKSSTQNYAAPQVKEPDIDAVALINKKLQDASKQYEKTKEEVRKYKKANEGLKEENDLLLRENQRLRMEICSRSPHRYGRTTVAALQSQIDSYEKEVHQLNRALEKSDGYIEELEEELAVFRGTDGKEIQVSDKKPKPSCKESKAVTKQNHKKKLFMDTNESNEDLITKDGGDAATTSGISQQKKVNVSSILVTSDTKPPDSPTKGSKKVTFSLPDDPPSSSKMSSFDLEMPSPMSHSSAENSVESSCETTPSFPTTAISSGKNISQSMKETVTQSSYPKNQEVVSYKKQKPRTLDDSMEIESELDELDISVTPELKDCMKLFSMAEKKVQQRNSLGGQSSVSSDSPLEQPSPIQGRVVRKSKSDKSVLDTDLPKPSSNYSKYEESQPCQKSQVDSTTGPVISALLSVDPGYQFSASSNSYRTSSVVGGSLGPKRDNSLKGIDFVSSDNYRRAGSDAVNGLTVSRNDVSSVFNPGFKSASESIASGSVVSGSVVSGSVMSGSVVSNILKPNSHQANYIPPPLRQATHINSEKFLHSQHFSGNTISSLPSSILSDPPRAHITIGNSQPMLPGPTPVLSQPVMANSSSTETLTSSLMKLEQTLAAHRSSTQFKYPSNHTVPVISNAGPISELSSTRFSLSSIAPPLAAATTTRADLSSIKSMPPPPSFNQNFNHFSHSSGSVPDLPHPIGMGSATTTLNHMPYPSAASVSNSILYGQNAMPSTSYPKDPSKSGDPFVSTSGIPRSGFSGKEKLNNYSYVSNSSLNSNDLSLSDGSFLPEPKKRLFETDTDDTDMSFLSPVKSSKLK